MWSWPHISFASITAMYCWLGHRRLQLTSYSVSWMLQHVFSVVRRSLIVDCPSLCMSTFNWLDVPERVKYKLATIVHNCLHGKAPSYLTDCCTPISDVASRRHLRSASRRQLLVPRHNLSTYGRRFFLSRVRLPGTACETNCVNRC